MNNRLLLICVAVLVICSYIAGCNWNKGHKEVKTIKGKIDTVIVKSPPKETVLTRFKTDTISKTDTIYRNIVTMDSEQCNEVKGAELRSTDSLVTVNLVYRGELLRSKITQSEFTKYITTHDTIYKHDKTWDVNCGAFVTRDVVVSGGVMLGLRLKNVNVGVTVDPFQNRSGVYFTMGLR